MAKVTRHGGPTHYAWVPITRPQIGAVDQCHGGSSTTSIPNTPTESEPTELPLESLVSTTENPSPLSEQSENVDSVDESMVPAETTKPVRKPRKRKPASEFDF
jgi:hypothetical protein